MKKVLLFFYLMLAMAAQAQSLDGEWKSEQTEKNGKMDITLQFSETELNVKITGTIADPEFGTVVVSASLPCSYLRDGSMLSVKPHTEAAKMNLEKMEFQGELADSLEANPEIKEFIKTLLVATLDEKKNEYLKEFAFESVELQIVSQTDTTLAIRDDKDKEMVFTRVKEE